MVINNNNGGSNPQHNGGVSGQPLVAGTGTAASAETIPLQNIVMATAGGADNGGTLRRQFQGNVYQYVGQRDGGSETNYNAANGHHYETTSEIQQ